MLSLAKGTQPSALSQSASARLSVWSRRLLTVATVLVLFAASMLALQAMGPDGRAMMACEGFLVQWDEK